MAGNLIAVWSRVWGEVWAPLKKSEAAPEDLFVELVRALVPEPKRPEPLPPPPAEAFNASGELVDEAVAIAIASHEKLVQEYQKARDRYETALSGETSRSYFRGFLLSAGKEGMAVKILEDSWLALEIFEDERLKQRYRALVSSFLSKYNIRYELRDPFMLSVNLSGVFSQLMSETRVIVGQDPHLCELFDEFEEALADLRQSRTPARMKNCLLRQFNLLEALAARCPGVTANTLGTMCNQLDLPHETIREVGKKLYGFRCGYPGLAHPGTPHSALRPISIKDFVSLSLMLAAFTPYVANGLDAERCYAGN